MRAKTDLFLLIKALTPAEIRYFKLHSGRQSRSDEKTYLEVFDAIKDMNSYDEQILRRRFGSGKSPNYIAEIKRYLYRRILRALRSFDDTRSLRNRLQSYIESARLLQRKSLYRQANDFLQKAKALAREFEHYHELCEILNLESLSVLATTTPDLPLVLEEIGRERRQAIQWAQDIIELRSVYELMFSYARSRLVPRGAQFDRMIDDCRNHPLVQRSDEEEQPFALQLYRLLILALAAQLKGEFRLTLQLRREIVTLWENNQHLQKESFTDYLIALVNYLDMTLRLERFDEFQAEYERVFGDLLPVPTTIDAPAGGELIPATPDERAEVFQNEWHLRLLYLLNRRLDEQALECVPRIEEGLQVYEGKINPARRLTMCYNVVVLYFSMRNFREGLHWTAIICSRSFTEQRQDIQNTSHILRLIMEWELEPKRLDEDFIKLTRKYLKDHNDSLLAFERTCLMYLRKLCFSADKRQRDRIYSNWRNNLSTFLNAPKAKSEGRSFGLREIFDWLEWKLARGA